MMFLPPHTPHALFEREAPIFSIHARMGMPTLEATVTAGAGDVIGLSMSAHSSRMLSNSRDTAFGVGWSAKRIKARNGDRKEYTASDYNRMNGIFQDLRYGLRGLRANPAFTILAVMALALGIGSVTTIFSVIDNQFATDRFL